MKMNKDPQFDKDIKQTLDRQKVDPQTADTLRQARLAALAHEPDRGIPRWLPVTAVTCLLLVAVLVVIRGTPTDELPQIAADELAVIASEDDLELLEELEFYIWYEGDKNV
jgi:hypothetical protein